MMKVTKDFEVITRGWELIVDYDGWMENPLDEWSLSEGLNIALFHNRYNLFNNTEYDHKDYNSFDEMENDILDDNKDIICIIPIYMYDHGNIAFSTGSFSCNFDSGQIGFIWITKSDMEKQKFTDYKAVVKDALQVYEDYINNANMYSYIIEKDGERVDSLCGIYATDIEELKQCILENVDVSEDELGTIKELTENLQF